MADMQCMRYGQKILLGMQQPNMTHLCCVFSNDNEVPFLDSFASGYADVIHCADI